MKVEEIVIGTPVIYYDVITEKGEKLYPFETKIISDPWELGGGHIVCKVEGLRGGVSIKHLEKHEK